MSIKFQNTLLTRHGATTNVELLQQADGDSTVRLPAVIDVNEEGLSIGVEVFDVLAKLGRVRFEAVTDGLTFGMLRYGYDEQVDILSLNINSVDSTSFDQHPASLYLNFTEDGRLAFLDVVQR